jgi:hypothetical protein
MATRHRRASPRCSTPAEQVENVLGGLLRLLNVDLLLCAGHIYLNLQAAHTFMRMIF